MFDATKTSDWWKGAVIYQVYPRSYQDTTGNGVGDLRGIAQRLEHIAALGADAVWISPFVRSPMLDFGYDVADYQSVDPLFGTLEDFRALLDKAHGLGLRVIMDQVLSHTSDQHAWFIESRETRSNPKADWYVWADARPDGTPPTNWLSVFGGSSWQWEPRRGQYYLHNFLRQMPDLNYHCPAVQEAILDTCRFWLDLGVDGFRLDVCTFYAHDPKLRNNPPNPEIPDGEAFRFNPYSQQLHMHDIGQPETIAFLERLRALCDSYGDRALLGELHESNAVRVHREYTAVKRLQLAYGYWLLGAHEITPPMLRRVAGDLGHSEDSGWPCWALDNHDFSRAITRLGAEDRPEAVTIILAALTCLRGATCLYQGSELGLPQADLPRESIIDPYGREFWPAYKGRDGSRTPMPWEEDRPNAGFSEADPWLPVPSSHRELAINRQVGLPGSTFNRLRQFLNWRKHIPALRDGGMEFLETSSNILAFRRDSEKGSVTCAFNFGATEEVMRLPDVETGKMLEGHGFAAVQKGDDIHLPPFGAFFSVREAA
ncbi:alpha-glucosidase family protein [Oceanibaculum pacificum]|uniref:Alpha-glucosidase n=1 Tax=Oceanibaculum pacificum TaxID=580166 RepID=A0A154WEL9_9PROT|nr:alpha-glucosidase family protein [Oceanibaculum pacificum]KZD11973.1 alpha-glucosidase [Oceanibaculum pacificum]